MFTVDLSFEDTLQIIPRPYVTLNCNWTLEIITKTVLSVTCSYVPINMLSDPPTRLFTYSITYSYIKHAGILSGPDWSLMDGLIMYACFFLFLL